MREGAASSRLPKWFWVITALALTLSSLPYLFALVTQPPNTVYFGVHWGFDDHAVYAAWAKQAQEGRLLFENRFTTDQQPGLTLQMYFLFIGNIAKWTGIPIAMHVGRLLFGFLFLLALYRLTRRLSESSFVQATAFATAIFGAGTGYLYWARYLGDLGMNRPIDVWQPEAFTFPSLMTNGLFCAALWLMLVFVNALLDAKDGWRPVIPGFLALLVLTNIHTYDTLTLALVGAGFLATQLFARTVSGVWILRAVVMASGAIPSLLWFLHVRSVDPVFAARAATVTVSPSLYNVLIGYGPLLLLALLAYFLGRYRPETGESPGSAHTACTLLLFLLVGLVFLQSGYSLDRPWLDVGPWAALFAVGLCICAWMRPQVPVYGLLFAWLTMGLIALYYPGLFQRKLAMGLSIPVGLSAGLAVAWLIERAKEDSRQALAVLAVLALSITSFKWIERDMLMARDNITNTLHLVFWPEEVGEILQTLKEKAEPGVSVAIAPPGIWRKEIVTTESGAQVEEYHLDIPDLNPVLTGWGGVRTYAGHWSETPDYGKRRAELMGALVLTEIGGATPQKLDSFIEQHGVSFVVLTRDGTSVRSAKYTTPETRLVRGSYFELYDVSLANDGPESSPTTRTSGE